VEKELISKPTVLCWVQIVTILKEPTRVYPKVSRLAAWSENCKWYSCIAIL
jgi:hypothetical protein